MKIKKIAYHRNGVRGNGFYVAAFTDDGRNMVGIVFDEEGSVAVLDVDLLASGVIEFYENSWRGDTFEIALREAILEYEAR